MPASVQHIESPDESRAEALRLAYNAAFEALGLSWQWDAATFAGLPQRGPRGVRAYVEEQYPHLLRAYDAEFLVEAIESTRERCQAAGTAAHAAARAPG